MSNLKIQVQIMVGSTRRRKPQVKIQEQSESEKLFLCRPISQKSDLDYKIVVVDSLLSTSSLQTCLF